MKKGSQILLLITLCFVFLISGIFIGRQMTRSGVVIDADAPLVRETYSASISDGRININTAGVEELCLLPNIGQTLAGRILAYREAHGPFQSIEDLKLVEGIGTERLKNIADYITTGG